MLIILTVILGGLSLTYVVKENGNNVACKPIDSEILAKNDNENKTIDEKNTSDNKEEQNIILNIKQSPDLNKGYFDVKGCAIDSDIIVRGTVTEINSYLSGPGVVSEYKVKVEKGYKNANEGDIISIICAGGIVLYDEYMNYGDRREESKKDFETKDNISEAELSKSKVKVQLGENDLPEVGKEYIIFAKNKKMSSGEYKYCVLTGFEGQFEVKNKKVSNNALKYKKDISIDRAACEC